MDARSLELGLARHIERFSSNKPMRPTPVAYAPTGKLRVTLKVRKKRLAMDHLFTVEVDTISELQAKLEAKKAARKAGWPIIAYVQDVEKV